MSERFPVHVLLSGGVDSAACAHFYLRFGCDVSALHVTYGQPAAASEKASAIKISRSYKIPIRHLTIKGAAVPASGEIAGRNAFLISAALIANGMNPCVIALGIHSGTPYYDCQPSFVRSWNDILAGYSDGRIQIGAPFLALSKADVWQFCLDESVPVALTWSCESSSRAPCGRCLSCRDREALRARA